MRDADKTPEMKKFVTSDLLSHASRLSNVSKVIVSRKGAEEAPSVMGSRRGSQLLIEEIENMRSKAKSGMGIYS